MQKKFFVSIHIKFLALIVFVLFFRQFASAQCTFDIDVQVIQQATCPANGIVQVTLSGDEIDLSQLIIQISSSNGQINEAKNINGFQFTGLPPHNYSITAQTVCKGTEIEVSKTATVTIESQYDMLNAIAGLREKSFSCLNTGSISFEIFNGKMPYNVSMIQTPVAYTGTTEFTYNDHNLQSIASLAAGNYVLQITDDCLSSVPLTFAVEKMASDYPADPFNSNASTVTSSCDGATASYVDLSTGHELYDFWYNRSNHYEVAFTVDGSAKNWLPTDNGGTQSFTLPQSYRSVLASGKPVDVWMRLAGTDCEQKVDVLQLDMPADISLTNTNKLVSCNTFDAQFHFDSSDDAAPCPPFRMEVRNSAGVLIDSATGVDANALFSRGLQTDTNYTLTVFDNSHVLIGTHSFQYTLVPPYLAGTPTSIKNADCKSYNLTYAILGDICYPLKREVFDENNILVKTETLTSHRSITNLEYDINYRIVITDVNNKVITFDNKKTISKQISHNATYRCNDYDLTFRPPEHFCDTYEWVLTTADGTEVDKSTAPVPATVSTAINNLQYNTAYKLKVYDGEEEVSATINYLRPKPYWQSYSNDDLQCADYQHCFSVNAMYCPPYQWKIYDKNGKVVHNGEFVATNQSHCVRLPYNENFSIKIFDSNSVTVLERAGIQANTPEETTYSYKASTSIAAPCFLGEFPLRDSLYIYSSNGIDAGTKIRFISGPQQPVHKNVSFTAPQEYFYPFSQDHSQLEQVAIADGNYVFEVTNPCGAKQNITITCKTNVFEIRDFSYIKDDETDVCNGVSRVYPQGYLYENSAKIDSVYFHLMETPSGPVTSPGTAATRIIATRTEPEPYLDNDDYFELNQIGKYVIGISNSPSISSSCIVDTIVVNHTQKNLAFEGRSSYVCSIGGIGRIIVAAKNGREPYSYELRTVTGIPVPIANNPNAAGIFEFGALGENYQVMITDACNRSFPVNIQINSLEQIPLSSGTDAVCAGQAIELSCWLMGAQAYQWSGPNGFIANTRVVNIPNVTAAHTGEYTVSVKPFGCDDFINRTHHLKVYDPQPPILPDIIYHCNTATPYQLTVTPDAGNIIQWFDSNEKPLPAAPLVDLSAQATYTFFAVQTDGEIGCESQKTKVVVTSNAANNITTDNRTICEGESVLFGDRYLKIAGTYTHTFKSSINGCDSIVKLNLTVNPTHYTELNRVIRDTETYFFAGKELNETGTYQDPHKNIYNCDSIIVLNLKVLPDIIAPPELFTPNNDGKNDTFEIKNLELYPKNSILIFNRWGNKVFEASPYLNNWDGRNHFGIRVGGDKLPAGTYFYILNLGNGKEPKKGYIYLNY